MEKRRGPGQQRSESKPRQLTVVATPNTVEHAIPHSFPSNVKSPWKSVPEPSQFTSSYPLLWTHDEKTSSMNTVQPRDDKQEVSVAQLVSARVFDVKVIRFLESPYTCFTIFSPSKYGCGGYINVHPTRPSVSRYFHLY